MIRGKSVKFSFLFMLVFSMYYGQDQRVIDSLTRLLSKEKMDTGKVRVLNQLTYLVSTVDPALAYGYGKKAVELADKNNFKSGLAHAYNNMGILYDQRGETDSSIMYYHKSVDLARTIGDIYREAGALGNLGYLYASEGSFDKALSYSLRALAIFDTSNRYVPTANIIEHVAMIYYELKEYKNSIKFHTQAIQVYRKGKAEENVAGVYANLALNYFDSNKDSMIYYLKKAENLFLKYQDDWSLGHVYNNIGGLYLEMKKPDLALAYLTKAREKRVAKGDERGMCATNSTLGMVWLKKGNTALAKKYIDTTITMALKMNMQEELAEAYRNYALIYGQVGNVDSVEKYLEKEITIKDSLFSNEKAVMIADMQTKYDTDKKDLEIARNKAELTVKEKQVFIKNSIIFFITGLLVLLVVMAYLFYRKKQVEQKAALAAEIALQKDIRARSIIEAEEKERRRIAQDLHDGIGQILSAAKLNLSSLESTLKTDNSAQKEALKNTLSLIDDSVKEVRTVSHSMMPNTLIKLGLASAVKEFITKIGSLPNLKIDLEIVGLDIRLEESTETAIYRAIQEIVNNIVKHAKANKISIQLIRHEKEISIVVEDNGIGFDTQKINEFEGIGLKNILSRIEFIAGKVHFDSHPGKGTTVVIEVPIS